MQPEAVRAGIRGIVAMLMLAGLILLGSWRLAHFDALVGYAFASLVAMFGITYRYSMWRQRLSIVYGILCIVLLLVVMQLWLLTATMNMWLGGNEAIIWPAAIASASLLGWSLGLMRYLTALDRPS